ncbi:MAG: hypothetical protein Q8P15_03705 [Nanoarchaeota archaeon]|nr:hypothetical protein [Nanoarchaeota archaeon]
MIYVQLGQEQVIQSKKNTLSSEINLLNIKKNMRTYHALRKEELKEKLKLYRKIKDMMKIVTRLQNTLPKIKIPKIVSEQKEKKEKSYIEEKIKNTKLEKQDTDLERQLREIQEKLRRLE